MSKRQLSPSKFPTEPSIKVTKRQTRSRSSSPTKRTRATTMTAPAPSIQKPARKSFTHLPGFPALVKDPKPYSAPLDFLKPSPWELPTKNNAITNFDHSIVARDALETNVVLHPRLPDLLTAFLRLKLAHGSNIEKELCANMSQPEFVARLIEKRVLHFVNVRDFCWKGSWGVRVEGCLID